MHLAENLIYLMALKNVSGKRLAEAVGLKATAISSYRSGTMPPLDKASKIAAFFGVSLEDFVNKNIKTEGIQKVTDNPAQEGINKRLVSTIARQEDLLQTLEAELKSLEGRADENEILKQLWDYVKENYPDLAKEVEDSFK